MEIPYGSLETLERTGARRFWRADLGRRCVAFAFEGDKPRLGVWLPGGAGLNLNAQLELYDRRGFKEQRPVIGQDANGDILAPMSTVYRTVSLKRQSDKKTDAKYNFYL